MNLLETYLREIHEIRSSGEATAETSYYGPLRNLLNERRPILAAPHFSWEKQD